MIFFFFLYWALVIALFFIGIITIIVSKIPETKKTGIRLTIFSLILLIIGAGVCGMIFYDFNLNGMH